MAERPDSKQNWQQREYIIFGPGCRLDVDNPQMGLNGTTVYDLLAQGDDGNTSSLGMTSGGLFHLTNDQCIDIIGGEKAGAGCCVNIVGRNGDVTITAQSNGMVKITGKNITIDADENITLDAGNDILLKSGNRIDLNTNTANCDALYGNLAPRDVTFAGQVFSGTKIGIESIESLRAKSIV